MNRTARNIGTIVAALGLLAAMGVASARRPGPADAEPFHAAVRHAADSMPRTIGSWIGSDQDVPEGAQKLLKPNVVIHRTFRHDPTGRSASLLLVQCKDARDMDGHYPPICYPQRGWKQDDARPVDWHVKGQTIPGTQYRYSFQGRDGVNRIYVSNFMIMPNGQVLRDMNGVRLASADYTRHFHGAAQVQLVTRANWTDDERRAVFEELIGANMEMIEVLRSGAAPSSAADDAD